MLKHYLDFLMDTMRSKWNDVALCDYGADSYTYGEMAASIERFHICFEKIGIHKGDKISICARNSARWGIAYLASNTYEAVTVPILADFRPEDASSLVEHSESVLLFTDSAIWGKMDVSQMPTLKYAININDISILYDIDGALTEAIDSVGEEFRKRYPDGFKSSDVHYPTDNAKDLAVINYTSGTTNSPKGVMLRYECFSSNVQFGIDNIPPQPGDRLVSILPLAHMFGFMFEFLYPVCGGASVYFLGKTPTPKLLLGAMAEVHPYMLFCVPLVMEKIYKNAIKPQVSKAYMKVLLAIPGISNLVLKVMHDRIMNAFGGKIRYIIMGGAAINPEVDEWLHRLKIPYSIGYGMTEAAPLISYDVWYKFKPGTCGSAIDRMEVRIDSSDPQNVPGEIQMRSVHIMSGYFKNESATAASFTPDGWMRSGDLGVIDAQGRIYIRGRSKNMILSSNGQNIYPEEIESLVNAQSYVAESVVLDRESHIVALIYLDEAGLRADGLDKPEDLERITSGILNAVNAKLPAYSRISKAELVDKPFEKTPKMSIRRFLYK